MKIGIFGTGMVGQNLAAKLDALGHEVTVGTRDVPATLSRTDPDPYGNPPFSQWLKGHQKVKIAAFPAAAAFGEFLINATHGEASLAALKTAGAGNIKGKILMDIANPLDASKGMPPRVSIADGDSLGERIQKAFPDAKVVKALNTVNALVQADPGSLAGGNHSIFISGNDKEAKKEVTALIKSFGWKDIIDLGDITTARGTEHYLTLWIRLLGALQTPMFSIKVVR
jgi:predicted dinucleotide-binding enzyme